MVLLPRRLLRDRVRVQPFTGTSAYGDVWGEALEVWGNVQARTQLTSTSQGDTDLVPVVVVLLPPAAALTDGSGTFDATTLTTQSRLVLPDAGDEAPVQESTRRVRSLQVHRVRGRAVAVELHTT